MTKLELRDNLMTIGFADETSSYVFDILEGTTRPYDWKNDVQCAVTFEFSKDLRMVKRKVYSIMDFLGDIGGLSGSLHALFGAAVIVFQYKVTYSEVA